MKKSLIVLGIFFLLFGGPLCLEMTSVQKMTEPELKEKGFIKIFNQENLEGWRKLTEYSQDFGYWEVESGVLVGSQFPEGKGGLLVTQKKYKNFELYAEVKADYPVDSGLFLRVQPSVLSYQITIDYRPDGEVGAVYCPLGGGFLLHNPEGKEIWNNDSYNQVWIRIQDQPPLIKVTINGEDVVEFKDELMEGKARVPEQGFVGVQVHPGESWGQGNRIYFREIWIKPIKSSKS